MKNLIISSSFIASLFLCATSMNAQSNSNNYWENVAQQYIQKADRAINYYNQYTQTFTPQQLQMMKTNPTQFTQLANQKTAAYQNALNQYSSYYNQNWSNSFNTFNSNPAPRVVYYNGQYYMVK